LAAAGERGTAHCHRTDIFAIGELAEQFWQNRSFTVAFAGKIHRPDVRNCGVHATSPWSFGPVAFAWLDLPQLQLEQTLEPLSGRCCAIPFRAAVRQNWSPASKNTAGLPALPSRGARHVIFLSRQIRKDQHVRSEAV